MKTHKGLSAIIGTVFLVAIVIGALSYVTYSMNILSDFSESLITEEKRQSDKQSEKFDITSVEITPANKLDGVISNTGQIPVKIKTLWIEEAGSPDTVKKFDIGEIISPGNKLDLLNSIDFDIDSTKAYTMKIISDRGTTQTFYVNSVGTSSLYMNTRTIPPTISNSFDATILMTVTNNATSTAPILNLTPTPYPVVDDSVCAPGCVATYVSGPTPASYPRLAPGDTATFAWVYTIDGVDADQITFTTSLQNGISTNTSTAVVEVRDILSALESGTAISSLGLQSNGIDSSILLFHRETDRTPSARYQMFSASADGGSNGQRITLDTTPAIFFAQNTSNTVTIPAGDWVSSLRLQSGAVPASLVGDGEDMLFHFNTNSAIQDNSEGTANADLEGCNPILVGPIAISASSDDAEQTNPSGTTNINNDDLEMPYDGSTNQYVGMRFTNIPIPRDAIITQAYITFTADFTDSSAITLRFNAQATDDATTFTATSNNLSPPPSGSRTRTTASATWSPGSWNNNNDYSTPTNLLNPVIQEIVNRPGWISGNDINIFVERVSASSSEKRRADSWDNGSGAPRLTIEYSIANGGPPVYSSIGGPHNSGAYNYGVGNACFRSITDVSSGNGNHLGSAPHSTALWFKTNAVVGSIDQYFVSWDDNAVSGDYARIYLEANTGKVVFKYSTSGSTDVTTCTSTSRYDDGQWYHVAAIRPGNNSCTLVITNLAGTTLETRTSSPSYGTSSVDVSGKWYVGSNSDENGNWFNGWIDDIVHWNSYAVKTSSPNEVYDLARTHYGPQSHMVNISVNKADASSGTNLSNVFTVNDFPVQFYDPVGTSFDTDSTYGTLNYTAALGSVVVYPNERLNYTVSTTPATSTWVPLPLNLKIDDETITPLTSLLQIPPPDTPFPSYWVYDKSNRLEVSIYNVGPQGSWFVYQGTRAVFYNPNGAISYAGVICSVNSTESDPCSTGGGNSAWRVMEDRDSIFIPVGAKAKVYFWSPQDRPDRDVPGGNVIPAGEYDMYVFIDGYDEKGAKFLRNLEMGRVKVQD
ncbi:LamG-like jellyroll fold domain-containing protein [Nitrosarchaeum sp.]|uniref:LamG-like jellyroll fold domain-containing protein n=1 Tax=Nitrosarchaeum sp. TaxID=2026886 RepID=UPI00247C59B0|nr:LamG-like jellyroll fold domain-containing protein [Nitrosarchaeum sp.]MCV0411637.1 hypothetical protein [Nitrosarchaeum sp.]